MIKSRVGGLTLGLVLLLLTQAMVAPSATAVGKKAYKPPACATAGNITEKGGGWTSIKWPEFPPRPLPQIHLAEDSAGLGWPLWPHPGDPDVLFVTDDTALMRSTDSGCTWTTVFEIPPAPTPEYPFSYHTSNIARLAMSPLPSARGYLYMGINTKVKVRDAAVQNVNIYRSRNLGDSWERWDEGLPPELYITGSLVVAPSDPDTVYLHAELGDKTTIRVLYGRTSSSGVWEQRDWTYSDSRGPCVEMVYVCEFSPLNLLVDPQDPQTLWGYENHPQPRKTRELMHSSDGGATWDFPLGRELSMWSIDILPKLGGGPSNVLAVSSAEYILRSKTGGESFEPLYNIKDDGLIYFGSTANQFVMIKDSKSDENVFRYVHRARKWLGIGHVVNTAGNRAHVVHYPSGQTHVLGTSYAAGDDSNRIVSIERYSGKL